MRTGRPLDISAQADLHENMFEEGYFDNEFQVHAQVRAQALELDKGNVQTVLNKIYTTPIKEEAVRSKPTPPRDRSSSTESAGRMTPNSINETSGDLNRCSSMLARPNINHLPSSSEAAQAAIFALDSCNSFPKISIPIRRSSTHGQAKTSVTSTHFGSHSDKENTTNHIEGRNFDRISINERFDALATHIALLQSDAVCTKQGSVLVTARSLNHQVSWLWDDLKKQLGEDFMSKTLEIGENVACKHNRASSQMPDEATLQNQKRQESDPSTLSPIRYNSWARFCEKLIETKAGQKEEADNFVQPTGPTVEPQARESTSGSKQREELANGTKVWKEQKLNQNTSDHSETRDSCSTKLSPQNYDNSVAIMTSHGGNLAKGMVDSTDKNSMYVHKVKGQRTVEEQQKILDDEIALLKKKKVRQELEREVAESEAKAEEVALRQKKKPEQWQKKWDDEREAKERKPKSKIEPGAEKQLWDGWEDIDWEMVFGVAAFIALGIPLGCTGAMFVWHIFFTIFRWVFLG